MQDRKNILSKNSSLILGFLTAASLWLAPHSLAQEGASIPPPQQQPAANPLLQFLAPKQDADASIKNFQSGQEPVAVPPITFIDVNEGRFGKLEIDLEDGLFLDAGVDKMHLIARKLDVKDGILKSLDIDVKGGHLHDFTFDRLTLSTNGDLEFDPGILLNHNLLQFRKPAQAEVKAMVTQESLNRYLNSSLTLKKLSVTAGGKVSQLANMMGMNANNIGLNLSQADLSIKKDNKLLIDFVSNLGLGQQTGVAINGSVEGTLALKDGLLDVSDAHLMTGGQEISPQLSTLLVKKIESVSQSIQHSNDIRFRFNDLKVVPGKYILLSGTADINCLRFGHAR